ncbi:MAG: sensor histidine kinase, partial [Gammaproteobacteria bacterium PRO9]|nr:sensor histidine kinase [Gammaproteobacteria bacterium PRO9]
MTPFKEREITAVVDALNGFVERTQEHARRERQFVETMSHELRTPLAVILGAAEVLDLSAVLEPKAAAALKRIQQTTWDLSNLAQVLLFLSGRKDR